MKKAEIPPFRSLNQIIALRLKEARMRRGWSQEETCKRLQEFLGVRWSDASLSAAEASAEGSRVREFTADEIYAFSRTFEQPVWFFFLLSEKRDEQELLAWIPRASRDTSLSALELLDLVILGLNPEDHDGEYDAQYILLSVLAHISDLLVRRSNIAKRLSLRRRNHSHGTNA